MKMTVSSLSQAWALDSGHKNTYAQIKTKKSFTDLYQMKIHIFLKKSMFIFLIISKKLKLKKAQKSSFFQVFLSLAIYSSSGNRSSLTQTWYQVAVIVHFYPSLKSSSGNWGPNVSISSQAQATCWCLISTHKNNATKCN